MVLPFDQFLRQVLGQTAPTPERVPAQVPQTGNAPFVPPVSQATQVGNPNRFMWLGDDPLVNPAVLEGQRGDNPTVPNTPVPPLVQAPAQQPVPIMSPAAFAAANAARAVGGQAAQQVPAAATERYSGTWQTVQYQYNGTNYIILVPEENLVYGLPEGAQAIGDPIVDDPERVARAVEAGNRGRQGDSFSGTLDQMPLEIQGVFRSSQDVADVSEGRDVPPVEVLSPAEWEAQNAETAAQSASQTTEAPVNDQGQTRSDVINELGSDTAEFDQMMQNVSRAARDPNAPTRDVYMGSDEAGDILSQAIPGVGENTRTITDTSRYTIPPLTTEQLRLTDEPKAALLESQGIFEIPGTMMVVQDASGQLHMRPASETAPEGMTIITYGGRSEPTPDREVGSPLDWAGQAMSLFGIPQRAYQDVVSSTTSAVSELPFMDPVIQAVGDTPILREFVASATQNAAPLSQYGSPAFSAWILANPDEASAAREGGYNGFFGERAVWERFQADRNVFERTMDTLLTDPSLLSATGVGGAVRNVGEVVAETRGLRLAGETIAEIGRILEVPEQIANEVVDGIIESIMRPIGRGIRGTRAGRAFDQTDVTAERNATEEVNTQLMDVVGQTPVVRGMNDIPPSAVTPPTPPVSPTGVPDQVVAPGVTQPSLVAPEDVVSPSAATTPDLPGPAVTTTPSVPSGANIEQGDLPGTWNVSDADGNPIPELQGATTRQVDEYFATPSVGQAPVDTGPAPLRQDADFVASKEGQQTEAIINSWDEKTGFIRPQTAAQREAGAGRVGEGFRQRPIDVARAIAPEETDRWTRFLRDYDRRVKNPTKGFIAREVDRQKARFSHFQSRRFKDQAEDGRALSRAYEILLEADHLARTEAPLFVREFSDVAELPEYQWKRWKYTRDSQPHTALDTLDETGGKYAPGTDLAEAVELAIFHPSQSVRDNALNDIIYRIGNRNDDGTIMRTMGGHAVLHPGIKKGAAPLSDILSTSQKQNLSIAGIRRDYEAVLDLDRQAADLHADTRLNADDAMSLSRQTNPEDIIQTENVLDNAVPEGVSQQTITSDTTVSPPPIVESGEEIFQRALARSLEEEAAQLDPLGAQRFEQDLAAGAAADVPIQAANTPLPLGARATSTIDAIPMPGGPAPLPGPGQAGFVGPLDPREVATSIHNLRQSREASRALPGIENRATRRSDTLAEQRANTSAGRIQDRKLNAQRLTDDQLQSFYVRGRVVSKSQMDTLGIRFSDNDETIIERWDRYVDEEVTALGPDAIDDAALAQIEHDAAQRTIRDFTADILPPDVREQFNAEFAKAAKRKVDDGTGTGAERPLTTVEAQIDALEAVGRQRKGGRSNRFWRRYDKVMAALRETFLYNIVTGPRYIATQMVGNTVTSLLTKHFGVAGDVMSPQAMLKAWRSAQKNGTLPDSLMASVRDEYGLGGERALTRGTSAIRDQGDVGVTEQLNFRRIPVIGRTSGIFANKHVRDMAAAFDTMPREALWAHFMDSNLVVARNTLRDRMLSTLPRSADPIQVGRMIDNMPQRFGAADIREAFGDIDARWADRHARDWQEALTKTDRAARDEVKRVFFTGDEANIDTVLKRTVFFHYWMSRAIPLYTEAMARNPVIAYQYANMLQAMSEDDDLSGSKFMRFFSTPMGYNILIRPDAFFSTFASLWEDAGYAPDGENLLGRALRNSPVMLNPLIAMATNMLGMQGEAFLPDPVGANKFIQIGQAAIDYANAQFGWDLNPGANTPVGNVQEDMLNWARSMITDKLDWVPGIDPVPYNDTMAYKENEVRSLIAEIALERGLSLDDPIVQQSMVDPESEMYEEAMRRYSLQDISDIAMRILPVTAVLYPRSQLASPKERTMAINRERESAASLGINQTQQSGDLFNERDTIAAATDYSRSLQQQQDQYMQLGSPESRGAYNLYNDIRYGSMTNALTINGQSYSADYINNLEPTQREAFADQWATAAGVMPLVEELRAQRREFRDAHPEYDAFTTWQVQLNDYPGGPVQWWMDTAEGNPNAARWFADLDEQDVMDEQRLTSLDAYMAYAGEQRAYWDDAPIATRTATDPTPYNPITGTGSSEGGTGTGQATQAGPTQENITQQITEYEADYALYEQAVAQFFGRPVNIESMNPMAREAAEWHLSQAGIEKPRMGGYLYDYMQWAQTQQGRDTSIATYLAWYAQQNPAATEVPAA